MSAVYRPMSIDKSFQLLPSIYKALSFYIHIFSHILGIWWKYFKNVCHALLSSANEVWVGHRNAGRPSVRPTCERDILRTA